MHIAITTDSFYPEINGLVTSLFQSTKALAEHGNQLLILAPQYANNNEISLHGDIKLYRLRSVPFPSYKGIRVIIPNKKEISTVLYKFQPDLIHIHQISVTTPIILKYAKLNNIPVVGSFHSLYTEMIEYILPYRLFKLHHLYEKRNDPEINNLTRHQLFKSMLWKVLKKYYQRLDAVITPTSAIKTVLLEYLELKNITVISNGIPIHEFLQKENYQATHKILHFGRISYERNVDIVVKAFSLYLQNTNNTKTELHIIGDGPELPRIKKLARKLQLQKRVIFLGAIARDQLKRTLKDYDFVVTASTMETQGMIVLESFAVGLPVIGVDRYALPDLVLQNFTGFIARAFDVNEIAYYMQKLASSQQLREKLGKNCQQEAKKHEINLVVQQLEQFYQHHIVKKNYQKECPAS